MDRKERNKKLTRLVELNERIRDLSVIMGKDIVLQESGKLWFLSDPTKMETVEMVVIWEIKQRVESLLASGSFDFLKVGEDTYPMETNALSAGFALDDYIADITASQREKTVRTPVIKMVVSLVTRTISIM